jgi:hypothetical protein
MLAALYLALVLAASSPDVHQRTVTKASVYLLKSPSFLAPRASTVAVYRNEKVKLEGAPQGGWYLVSYTPRKGPKLTGYLHASHLSDRPVAFRVDNKDVEGRGQVSGNYNLAVPGFKPEVAQQRERSNQNASAGYRAIEQYMPLDHSAAAKAGQLSSPPDASLLVAFVAQGHLREPSMPGPRTAQRAQPAPESAR